MALLPLADDARITLLHVVSAGLPAPEARERERDAIRALAEEERHLARSLPRGVSIEPVLRTGPRPPRSPRARATGAELVVMGRGGQRALDLARAARDVLTLLLRVIRRPARRRWSPLERRRLDLPRWAPARAPELALSTTLAILAASLSEPPAGRRRSPATAA